MATWVPEALNTVVGRGGRIIGAFLAAGLTQGSVKDDFKGVKWRGTVRQPESSSDLRVHAPHTQNVWGVNLSNEAIVNISR